MPPSPNVHDQLVGLPVELSVKATVKGAAPEVGAPWKFAVGAVPEAHDYLSLIDYNVRTLARVMR